MRAEWIIRAAASVAAFSNRTIWMEVIPWN